MTAQVVVHSDWEWCIDSGKMVHVSCGRGTLDRYAGLVALLLYFVGGKEKSYHGGAAEFHRQR